MDAMKPDYAAALNREFLEMTANLPREDFAAVLRDCNTADTDERAKLLPIHAVITRVQTLLDAADGDSSEFLQDCLIALQEREREVLAIEGAELESYYSEQERLGSGARNI